MDDSSALEAARQTNGRFGPGSPGRPSGTRNRASRRIALALLRNFENEKVVLERLLHRHHLNDYIRLIGRTLPPDAGDDAPDLDALAPEEAAHVASKVRVALDRAQAGEGSLTEVREALDDLPPDASHLYYR